MRAHCAFQGYLHKHLKETLGLAKFCNVAIVYKQREKEAAHRSDAAAHEHEMFTMAHLLVCERSTSRTATNNSANLDTLLMDPACLYHAAEHILYILLN